MAYSGAVPDTAARPLDWMDRMACREEDPDMFFAKDRQHEARLICVVRCPVRTECLASVKEAERGAHRDYRDGIVAGLAHNERWRLDVEAIRCKDDTVPLILDGTEPCGTHNALLGHLWRAERIDPECWSAEVRRDRLERATAARTSNPAAAEPAPSEVPLKTAS
ncbi:WhiB family transcriptional regulator [Streptomyces sp. NPDC005648]|uniref:WhiB family transcriptional regulator n=1 Tax=Streptomyces sp. NPDC005648 TaxID=3157044 RepID=UPI0033B790A8